MPLSEHVHCVAVAFKMTECVEQQICNKFCIKLEHSSMETFGWLRRPQLWATGDWQLHYEHTCWCITSCAEFFGKTLNDQGDSAPLQPIFGALWLLAFPKTKITLEREEISDCWWDSGKYGRAADGDWENCVRSKGAYFEGDWGVIVRCTMFLVSCIFNKCLFFTAHGWIPSG